MAGSALTGFPYIQENSEATPGLWNNIFSTLSQNVAEANNSSNLSSNVSTLGMVTINASSQVTDYIQFHDPSNQKSDYLIGSFTTGTADGLNIYDASGGTMIVSFSKQSVRFFQNIVGPVFDTGGALTGTYNAATFGTGSQSTESRIQAAINQASVDSVARVYIPANMYPYSASSVSFINTVQLIREGGDPSAWDVRAYGADNTAVLDATAAFIGCLNALPNPAGVVGPHFSKGGIMTVPAGSYLVSSTLTLPVSGSAIVGQGAQTTEIRYTATTGDCLYFNNPATVGQIVPEVTIRGIRVTVKSGITHTSGAGIHIDNAGASPFNVGGTRINFDDVTSWYFNNAFNLYVIQGGNLTDCEAQYSNSTGWWIHGECNNANFAGCTAAVCTGPGWAIGGAAYASFAGCQSRSNSSWGFYIAQGTGDAAMQGNTFSAIEIENCPNAFYIKGNQQATFVNLAVSGGASAVDGVVLDGCKGVTLTGYLLANGATGYAIHGLNPTAIDNTTFIGSDWNVWGAGPMTGVDNITFINCLNGARRSSLGGAVSTTGFGNGFIVQSGVTGVASESLTDDRYVTTDNKGAAFKRISADGGNSFTDLWNNSLVGGPWTMGGQGDAILSATGGNVILASNATVTLTASPGAIKVWRDPANNLLVSVSSQGLVSYTASGVSAAHTFGNGLGIVDGLSNSPGLYFTSAASVGWYKAGSSSMALTGGGQLLVPGGSSLLPGIAFTSALSTGFINNATPGMDHYVAGVLTWRSLTGQFTFVSGSALAPGLAEASEKSMGFWRSGTSTIALSYGTFNLNQARLVSIATNASNSGLNAVLAASEFAIGVGVSNATLMFRSGNTTYLWGTSSTTSS